jgi:hypothetical protein
MTTTSDGVIPATIITTFPSDRIMEDTSVAIVVITQAHTTGITRHITALTTAAPMVHRRSINVGLG